MSIYFKKALVCKLFATIGLIALTASFTSGQKASVTISLDERFFDALLDSVFQNFALPEFNIAEQLSSPEYPKVGAAGLMSSFARNGGRRCSQSVKILREMSGVRTAVRFREGKIYVPLAFSGNYAPPFVGCVEFAGWAESHIDLEFQPESQRLIGRARVFNVNLNGSGGMGGALIARMLQTSIDKKLNPIEILTLDKLSFGVPVQGTGNLRLRAVGARPLMGNGVLNLQIDYIFAKE